MANRVVKIVYDVAVDGAVANVKKLAAATNDYAQRGAERVRKNEAAFQSLTTTLAVGGAAAGAALGVMTKTWMGFDKEMSGVKAVAGATAEEMSRLEKAAIDLGASTVFSASEVAQAQSELAKAGVSVEQMLSGGLKGALDLAAAGGLDLAQASTIAAQAMNLFNLEGKDVPRVADVLASAANKSAADVTDLGQAMQQAGTVASQTGLSLEETAAALAMFADQGIRGSDAGTSLKTMLQRLTPQSKEAQRVMDDLGFSAYDAQGEFIGLEGLARELQESFGGLDTESRNAALGVAFGSDAIRGAAILMEGGADAAREYEQAMHDSGAAARMASTMTDNLAGDIEQLGGALETGLIQGGSAMNDTLRGIVQGLTGLVDMANSAPRPLQNVAVGLMGVATVGGLGAGAVLKVGTSLVSLGDDIASVAGKATGLSKAIGGIGGVLAGPWGLAIAGGVAALGLYAIEQGKTRARVQELSDSLDEQTGAITENSEEMAKKTLQDKGAYDAAERLGVPLDLVTRAALGQSDAMSELNERLAVYSQKDGEIRTRRGGLSSTERDYRAITQAIFGVNAELDEAKRLWEQNEAASAKASEGGMLFAESVARLGLATADYATEQQSLNGGIDMFLTRTEEAMLAGDGAAEAMAEWKGEMAGLSASFIDTSAALQASNDDARAWAEGQAEATADASDSWEDYVQDATFALDTWLAELEKQVAAQEAYEANMLRLSGRLSDAALQMVADMGPAGAQAAAALVDGTDAELARFEAVAAARGAGGAGEFADAMYDAAPVIRAAAAVLGQDAADEIAAQIAAGEITAAEAVALYDLHALVEVDAETTNYAATLGAAIGMAEGADPIVQILGEAALAEGELLGFEGRVKGSRPVARIDANDALAEGERLGWDRRVRGTTSTAKLDADRSRADSKASAWQRWASGLTAWSTVDARTGPATSAVSGLLGWIGRQWATVNVQARYAGGLNVGGAARHMVSARAAGGIERRPALAGPQYGRTNVILWGEPETRGEAFISNHPAYRDENLRYLETAASWFDMALVKKYAAGHVAQHRFSSPAPVYSLPVQGRISDGPAALSGPLDLSDSSARLVARYIGTEFRGSQREAVDRAIRVDRGRGTNRLPVMPGERL